MDALINDDLSEGYLSSFLANNLKTTQLELNTDLQTSRAIARLKEPRNLFALPKDKENECSQQTARWPAECQVLDERISHISYVPASPEPYYKCTGHELQPRPVGEENGVVVFTYNPISAVNYLSRIINPHRSSGDSSDSSSDDEHDDNVDVDSARKSSDNTSKSSSSQRSQVTLLHSKSQLPLSNAICCSSSNSNSNTSSKSIASSTHPLLDKTAHVTCKIPPLTQLNTNRNAHNKSYDNCFDVAQFSRSSIGSAKYMTNAHPNQCAGHVANDDLLFESRFESGNLAKAIKITPVYYELYLRPDLYTNKHTQWFYFRARNMTKGITYRISIVNLVKSGSLYNEGMRPLMYSEIDAAESKIGWRRCGENIAYFKNEDSTSSIEDDDDCCTYTLTFNIEFPHDNDSVYFAHSYPYTYSDLQDYLMAIQKHPIKSKFCKLRLLCRSLAGNNVYCLTVTAPVADDELAKKKRAIVVSARVHPGETPSSWMMKGLMDFLTGESNMAKKLRHKFIFKLIPMLNPDGVIVGNTRSSLTGKDLNRQYRTVIRETYPSIWYTKTMIKRLTEDCGVMMYCDMHAHSRKHNIFIYGCENKREPDKKLTEQVFPLMLHKNIADKFSFESCKFKVQRSKEGTGRIVIWMLGITNSYTMEASFGGSTLGCRAMTHFSTADYEHIGRGFCETLLDYGDENPNKEKLRIKILARLNEGGSNADEPTNIKLSDYSSDEGDTSNSGSDNEYNSFDCAEEGFCCQSIPLVPPSSPVTATKSTHPKLQRTKAKSSSRPSIATLRKTNQYHRSAIDLPTTEPFLECYTSDCDECTENRLCTMKTPLRQSSRADGTAKSTEKGIPDELIITSAKRHESKSDTTDNDDKCRPSLVDELPAIKGPKRFNSAWSNMKSIRIKNMSYQQTMDNLKLKLTLKKQIWTGGSSSTDNETDKTNQPLAWGISVINRRKTIKPDPNEELLAECSQKLLIWKKDEGKRKKRAKKQNHRQVTVPRIVITNEKSNNTASEKPVPRKKLPALNRSSSESPHNFNTANKSKALLRSQTEIIPLTTAKLARVKTSNKFKTGAIVATTCLKSTTNKVNESIDCDTDKTGAATDLNRSPICGRITLRKIRSKFRKKTKKVNNSISTEEPPIQAILENNNEI